MGTGGRTMFAQVRESTYDLDKLSQGQAQQDEWRALQARQPGFAGVVAVDAGNGRRVTLLLWESEAQATAAQEVLAPAAARLLGPLRTVQSQVIVQGPVLRTDLAKA